ncbi:Flp pilus assembly complex ATPase component TadA [Cereibacter sphaeroides]|uniref:ATPase, T2SS/T4P/T4SS family n=1 Tax=Cereibacter sphaeroides TaxID=1063 RepID=UPI001F259C90|nr:ATPase, T2SS/T4P/T4SS family [Cereibacter sphaeroides]MCE6958094.1 Flp pilus assembly complex ATPase component TadA [Cereibacter sphaeroides]MCE6971419.1 Flp pilus assembly complex ATPase component TadA [Cereibacter sphaeroides]
MALFGPSRKVFKNGLIDAPEEQREIVAVYENGEIFFASGKKFHLHVREAQTYVRKTLGKDPVLEEVSGSDVLAHYEAVMAEGSGEKSESYERIADRILRDAANSKAADIKIIRTPERSVVRFMIAGQEIDYGVSITSLEGNSLIAYIFDGRDEGAGHSTKVQGEFQGFSVSNAKNRLNSGLTLPANVLKLRCQKGFHETSQDIMDHLAIRVFYRESEEMASLEALGLDPMVLAALQRARDGMKGAVMIGGETGDGKSTSIISAVKRQYAEHEGRISIVTVEDPVEYKLDEPGIIQIPIQSSGDAAKRTQNYRAALMHFVRINPHVGVVSEIRDAEAARQVLQFIETGHQVWTTIHINSVNSIPFRLIDMGIEPTELSKPDSLKLLMKQTLVPLLCRCATRGDDGFMHRNTGGCPICRSKVKGPEAELAWSGYQRLVAVAEMIEPDDDYLGLIRKNDAIGAKNYWEKPVDRGGMGGVTLKQKLLYLANMGAIDPKNAIKKGAPMPPLRLADLDMDPVYHDWIQALLDKRKG